MRVRRALAPLLALLHAKSTTGAHSSCSVGRPSSVVCHLNNSQTVEYELRESHSWQWFALQTNDVAAVTAGLVMQRGYQDAFPRIGFVMLASSSGVPPGSFQTAEYNPTTFAHDDPIGPRRKHEYMVGVPPQRDWLVLTLGIDPNATADQPTAVPVHIPLGQVLVGLRCNEEAWNQVNFFPGCRLSLTATLLPFEMADNLTVSAPMARGDAHVYKVDVGDYDSLNVSITRDVNNRTHDPARGVIGAAMINLDRWSRPGPLHFPYNLSGAPGESDLPTLPAETQAMQAYVYQALRQDKGLLNLRGCADGTGGCRSQYLPIATDPSLDPETEKQMLLRNHLWARALPTGRSYSSLSTDLHDTYVQRVCIDAEAMGTYYLTIYADDQLSGDGRLSASGRQGGEAPLGGYYATDDAGNPYGGVDDFGWWQSSDNEGCFCCGEDYSLEPGVCGYCNPGAGPICAGQTMAAASRRTVLGYTMTVTHLAFTSGLISSDSTLMGCVSYGQRRYYTVQTTSMDDAQVLVRLSSVVGGLYATSSGVGPPNETNFELAALPPLKELTLSPCDVAAATTWQIAIVLGAESEGLEETLFTMTLQSSSARSVIGPGAKLGTACCGGMVSSAVPGVPGHQALRVNLTVLEGAVHALFLQYDSCPEYVPGDLTKTCNGLCEVGWVTRWDAITGERSSLQHLELTVPMGETVTESDERRAGTWYVGVKALPTESALYLLQFSLASPKPIPKKPYCTSLDRFCASYTQRYATLPVTTAADARAPGSAHFLLDSPAPPLRRASVALAASVSLVVASCLHRQRDHGRRRVDAAI